MRKSSATPAGTTRPEPDGINHIPDSRRHGRARDQFSMRFSPVVYLAPVVLGGVGAPWASA